MPRGSQTVAGSLAAQMTEAALERAVEEAATLSRWRVYHTRDSRGSNPGFPDLVLVRRGRLIFAELKTERGRVSPDQKGWLEALEFVGDLVQMPHDRGEVGVEVYVWRPADWYSGAVTRALS